ncbi:uncharacterized protein A4U43_C04F8070 [Asparagus officinalis]|uniref:Uncharacterized protein n=1 Tax=Asparagus officinalis TaxID=4686 RepID=A0A5P1EZL5_ASPOF|nr:uncharacterized protein A4U43_C04F8070 [Asparagus officinalis]
MGTGSLAEALVRRSGRPSIVVAERMGTRIRGAKKQVMAKHRIQDNDQEFICKSDEIAADTSNFIAEFSTYKSTLPATTKTEVLSLDQHLTETISRSRSQYSPKNLDQ